MQRDLCVPDPGNELAPGVLVAMAEGSEVVADFLDLLFCLPVRLWVIARVYTHCDVEEFEKTLPHLGN